MSLTTWYEFSLIVSALLCALDRLEPGANGGRLRRSLVPVAACAQALAWLHPGVKERDVSG